MLNGKGRHKGCILFCPHPTRISEVSKLYIRGKIYLFTYLPNGLCLGPRKFTKLLKSPLSYLRLQQVIAAGFIDILITMGRSFVTCERNIKLIVTVLDSLGFVVHPDKPIFVPQLDQLNIWVL